MIRNIFDLYPIDLDDFIETPIKEDSFPYSYASRRVLLKKHKDTDMLSCSSNPFLNALSLKEFLSMKDKEIDNFKNKHIKEYLYIKNLSSHIFDLKTLVSNLFIKDFNKLIMSNFKGRDLDIILLRVQGITLEEIGSPLNLSRERVRQLEHRFNENFKLFFQNLMRDKLFVLYLNDNIKNLMKDNNSFLKDLFLKDCISNFNNSKEGTHSLFLFLSFYGLELINHSLFDLYFKSYEKLNVSLKMFDIIEKINSYKFKKGLPFVKIKDVCNSGVSFKELDFLKKESIFLFKNNNILFSNKSDFYDVMIEKVISDITEHAGLLYLKGLSYNSPYWSLTGLTQTLIHNKDYFSPKDGFWRKADSIVMKRKIPKLKDWGISSVHQKLSNESLFKDITLDENAFINAGSKIMSLSKEKSLAFFLGSNEDENFLIDSLKICVFSKENLKPIICSLMLLFAFFTRHESKNRISFVSFLKGVLNNTQDSYAFSNGSKIFLVSFQKTILKLIYDLKLEHGFYFESDNWNLTAKLQTGFQWSDLSRFIVNSCMIERNTIPLELIILSHHYSDIGFIFSEMEKFFRKEISPKEFYDNCSQSVFWPNWSVEDLDKRQSTLRLSQ